MSAIGDLFAATPSGGLAPPPRPPRVAEPPGPVFFALYPDAAGAAAAGSITERLRDEHVLTGRPIASERRHVSLVAVGQYPNLPEEAVWAVRKVAAGIDASSFDIVLDSAMTFMTRQLAKPVVLVGGDGVAGVELFQRKLVMALKDAGFPFRRKLPPFTPHMTLLYDGRGVPEQPVAPVRWTVREFVLVHSHHGHSRHVPLARFPLRG
ncbi:MAG TPA: 2'-5' RNA ligase family protein [Stellaceae bacterium]|nr:2'-5' RNA ligase family protein [Stellaceae bacterium]